MKKYFDNNPQKSIKNKVIALFLLVVLAFSLFHFLRIQKRQTDVNKEVLALEKQIEEFEKKNKNLEQFSEYFQTDEFKEKKAKEKLNLVKEGEKVVIVKKNEIQEEIEKKESLKPEIEIERPNYYCWWYYFFGIKS